MKAMLQILLVIYQYVENFQQIVLIYLLSSYQLKSITHRITSTVGDARHQEENPMRKKCLKAVVQEGHNICSREWQMLSVYLQIKILV